jgi:iron complex transport system substrate-binding protein
MKRVLSLLPSTTEIVYAIGAEDQLVGVTHECDYPGEAQSKPRVTSARITPAMESHEIDALVREQLDESGTLYSLDMELVRELRPDIVLTQQLCTVCAVGYATVHAAMQSLPEPPQVINIEPRTLDEVLGSIVTIGELLDLKARAQEYVAELRERLSSIPPLEPAPSLLLLEWLIPPFSAGHWMAELVEAAGANPVLDNRGEHSRQLEWSRICESEFDVLVVSCCGFNVERAMHDIESSEELRALRNERPGLRIIVFDGNHFFSRPGPRLVESAELLHNALAGRSAAEVTSSIGRPFVELSHVAGTAP